MTIRWTVGHSGSRDNYQVALALHEQGKLERLVTDFYAPPVLAGASKFLEARSQKGLPARYVSQVAPLQSVARFLGRHIPPGEYGTYFDDLVAMKMRANLYEPRDHAIGVLSYSYSLPSLSPGHRPRAPLVVFQVHPAPHQVREILAMDRKESGIDLGRREEELLSPEFVDRYGAAIREADAILTASTFTRRGIEELGVESEKVFTIPYGAPDGWGMDHAPRRSQRSPRDPLRVLFVGQANYRKGLHHLTEALDRAGAASIRLTVATRGGDYLEQVASRQSPSLRIVIGATRTELRNLYETHDVLVLPSLVEGFGLVLLEAMSTGLPVIATKNTGAADLLENFPEAGWLVEAGDASALSSAMLLARDSDPGPRIDAAVACGQYFSWSRFRSGIRSSIEKIERGIIGS